MNLSIENIFPVKSCFVAPKKHVKNIEVKNNNSEINLNNDPAAVNFKGFFDFFNKAPQRTPEPRIYGPHKVTKTEAVQSDNDARYIVDIIASYIDTQNYEKPLNDRYVRARATDKFLDSLKEPFFSLICYYQKSPTSYPMFYDCVSRAIPKACAEADLKYQNDNATRLYEKIRKDIKEYGKEFEPGTRNPFESGIKYLYRTHDFSGFALADDEDSTEETLQHFKEGRMPSLDKELFVCSRSHQSTVDNEDYYYRNTKYGHITTNTSTPNSYDARENMNYQTRPKQYVEDTFELDPWKFNP